MADIYYDKNYVRAKDKLEEVIKFNEGRGQGQYNWIYIVELSDGFMVRLSQDEPTAKNVSYRRKLIR